MSSVLTCSHCIIMAAAMAASGAVILLSLRRHNKVFHQLLSDEKHRDPKRTLRSCLSSGVKQKKTTNKRVRFADDVKQLPLKAAVSNSTQRTRQSRHNRDHHRHRVISSTVTTRETNQKKPCKVSMSVVNKGESSSNREALYRGILRDRVHIHRMQCSY